jgi:hypothetical protein
MLQSKQKPWFSSGGKAGAFRGSKGGVRRNPSMTPRCALRRSSVLSPVILNNPLAPTHIFGWTGGAKIFLSHLSRSSPKELENGVLKRKELPSADSSSFFALTRRAAIVPRLIFSRKKVSHLSPPSQSDSLCSMPVASMRRRRRSGGRCVVRKCKHK